MARKTRATQYQYGDTGDQNKFQQFGSRVAGAPLPTKDPSAIQALTAFTRNGWPDAVNVANKAPFMEDMNGLFYLLFYQLCYGFQEGIPEWDSGTTYYQFSMVKKPGTFELYGSLIDNNTNQALPSQTDNGAWHYLNPPSVAPGIIADYGGATAPFGWLFCDGGVFSQAAYPALFAAIGTTWNTGGEGAGNFRLPDFRGRATIGVGSGPGGLTPRTLAQLIGQESLNISVGQLPPHAHGVSDPGHFHTVPSTGVGALPAGGSLFGTSGGGSSFNSGVKTTGISISATGNGEPITLMQPSAVVTKVIKY